MKFLTFFFQAGGEKIGHYLSEEQREIVKAIPRLHMFFIKKGFFPK